MSDPSGATVPALVAQPFGRAVRGAVDRRPVAVAPAPRRRKQDDFERAWRQTVRWLVADVPGRVDLRATSAAGTATPTTELTVRASDPEYQPLDNAAVSVRVVRPNQEEVTLNAEPDAREAGTYAAKFVPREPGAYRAVATVAGPDGSAVGRREVGWCVQPEADEFARLDPNRELLEAIASRTNGEVVSADGLDEFVASLPSRKAPNIETWVSPLWHRASYFLVAMLCLVAEWGLRRRFGMA